MTVSSALVEDSFDFFLTLQRILIETQNLNFLGSLSLDSGVL